MLHAKLLLATVLAMAGTHVVTAQDDVAEPVIAGGQARESEDAAAEVDGFDREPVDCLSLNRIRRTEVIDDSTIVFYVGRREPYVNNLPRRCPGLKVNGRFSYKVDTSRLCGTDWITVLEDFAGRLGTGFTCRLGVFHPTNLDVVALLKEAAETGGAAPTSTAVPVELPDAGSDEGGESSRD